MFVIELDHLCSSSYFCELGFEMLILRHLQGPRRYLKLICFWLGIRRKLSALDHIRIKHNKYNGEQKKKTLTANKNDSVRYNRSVSLHNPQKLFPPVF